MQNVVFLAEVHDRTEEAQRVLDERDQHAQFCDCANQAEGDQRLPIKTHGDAGHGNVPHHAGAAEPDDAGYRDRRENIDHGVVERVGKDRVLVRVHVAAIDFREASVGFALAIEELQHHHAADVLLQVGVDAGDGDANAAIGVAHLVAKNLGRPDDEGQHGKGDQRQLPVHAQHHAEDAGEHEDIFEDGDHAGSEHFIQGVDVGGDARDQAANGVLVEEGYVQALQMAEDLAAKVEHHLLASPLHEIGLQEFEQETENEQSDVNGSDLRDAGDGVGLSQLQMPEDVAVAASRGAR